MNNRRTTTIAIIVALAVIVLLYFWNIPRSAVNTTLDSVDFSGPIYQTETGAFDQFFMTLTFENEGRTRVEITKLDVNVLLNGTDYNSQMTTHNLGGIEPSNSRTFHRTVLLTNAPIGFRENEAWNLTGIAEITAEAEFLFFRYKKSMREIRSYPWEIDFLD
ncbi:hypothetical protein GF319_03665 [Candidatus Bathyarchaeota archaeon]|jgi:hypothetical protein|nr:hypothetical protein [Candidatus Bathyarchaeota archaeon]